MKRTTERKWHSWLSGVALTICPSMWRRQRRLCWTSGGGTPLTTPHWPSTARLWRESAALNSWGAHHGGSHLDHQHHVTLQEGTTAPTLSPPAEKSKSPTTHPHDILQGHHWECADQLHHCLVRELQCCWPQDPSADSEHGCKDHRCPSPIHPGHFPCTMLQQNQQHREGPHPPLPQSSSSSYHQEDGTGASEPAPPDCSTAFSPRLWEPWTQITPPSSKKNHAPPHPPSPTPPQPPLSNTPQPPPLQTPPNLTTPKKKTVNFFCAIQVWPHTGEWACTNHL